MMEKTTVNDKYLLQKKLTFEEDRMEHHKIVINDIKKAVPIHRTVRLAAKRKKDNK